MRFLADMGVSWRVVEWLRAEGHDAVHLREQQLHRLPNGGIFTKAADEQRVILTWDLDFTEIVALSETRLVSAVVFHLLNTRSENVFADWRACSQNQPETWKKAQLSPWKIGGIGFASCLLAVSDNLPRLVSSTSTLDKERTTH